MTAVRLATDPPSILDDLAESFVRRAACLAVLGLVGVDRVCPVCGRLDLIHGPHDLMTCAESRRAEKAP